MEENSYEEDFDQASALGTPSGSQEFGKENGLTRNICYRCQNDDCPP